MVGAQTIIVHGATDGIGRELALRMARRGDTVFATGTQAKALDDLREAANGLSNLQTVRVNPWSADSIARLTRRVNHDSQNLGVDVLINNSGCDLDANLPEPVGMRDICAQLEHGLLGMVALIGAFVPQMRVRGSGRIINISPTTAAGLLPSAGRLCRGAARALSSTLRKELAPFGIDVVFVETPGPVVDEVELAVRAKPTSSFLARRGEQALTALSRVIGERWTEPISRFFEAATARASGGFFGERRN